MMSTHTPLKQRKKLIAVVAIGVISSLLIGGYVYLSTVGVPVGPLTVKGGVDASAYSSTQNCTSPNYLPNLRIDWQGNSSINIQKFVEWSNQNETNGGMLGSINP